jgi:hypothetical protein
MKGHWIRYSAKELAWLKANRKLVIGEYAARFRERFGRNDVTAANLHALRKRKGWKTGRTGCFAKGHESANKGKPFPVAARHPNCKRTHFKKGGLPHNTKFAGHEYVNRDGYVEINVNETNPHTGFERRYVHKHRWLWEKANGPVPEGHALKCLDGNRLNTDPTNWEPVPRALLPRLNGGPLKQHIAFDDAPAALKPTILANAMLAHRAQAALRASTKKAA